MKNKITVFGNKGIIFFCAIALAVVGLALTGCPTEEDDLGKGGGGGEARELKLSIRDLSYSNFSKIEVYASDANKTVGAKLAETSATPTSGPTAPNVLLITVTPGENTNVYVIVKCYNEAGAVSHEWHNSFDSFQYNTNLPYEIDITPNDEVEA